MVILNIEYTSNHKFMSANFKYFYDSANTMVKLPIAVLVLNKLNHVDLQYDQTISITVIDTLKISTLHQS